MQHASETFSIPKTVLWRRIQKEGYQILRSEMKRSYGSDKREAAVKALERGENLTKVALEFKVNYLTFCLCSLVINLKAIMIIIFLDSENYFI